MSVCYIHRCEERAKDWLFATQEVVVVDGQEKKLYENHFICPSHKAEAERALIAAAVQMPKAMQCHIIAKLRGFNG